MNKKSTYAPRRLDRVPLHAQQHRHTRFQWRGYVYEYVMPTPARPAVWLRTRRLDRAA